jgi:hypothetical protein
METSALLHRREHLLQHTNLDDAVNTHDAAIARHDFEVTSLCHWPRQSQF